MALIRESEIVPYRHPEEGCPLFDLRGERIADRVEYATVEALYPACDALALQVFAKFREGHEVVSVVFYREVTGIDDLGTRRVRISVEIDDA